MQKIQNANLEQLLMQSKFTPPKKRHLQLVAAEQLLNIIDKDKEYPFEFIHFRITGHRPKTMLEFLPIKGDQLETDLRIFIARLSAKIAPPAELQDEKIYTTEQLAEMLAVSTKTISRWKKKGLVAKKFIFEDGTKRYGFPQSIVDKFTAQMPLAAQKAKQFSRTTKTQKQQIIRQAKALIKKTNISRYQVINRITEKSSRSHETIRYILLNYDKAHPDKAIFKKPAGIITPEQTSEIYKLSKQGLGAREIAKRFNKSKSSIYRIVNMGRARAVLSKKIDFIDSPQFLEDNAFETILPDDRMMRMRKDATHPPKLAKSSLSEYLQTVKNTPTLNREQEAELFRRYNYLKYLASITRTKIKRTKPSGILLTEVEDYLSEAEIINKRIIEANLRLVVSIANRHTAAGADLLELVSEGNMSLMRAAEKFDYTRGFRFGTYASLAISKDFARSIPQEAARREKPASDSLKEMHRDLRAPTAAGVVTIERTRQSLIKTIKENLDERERYIILHHFGLMGTRIRKKKKTLVQIGEDLDLTKERVRQIELFALKKLRQSLSRKEFELLTSE